MNITVQRGLEKIFCSSGEMFTVCREENILLSLNFRIQFGVNLNKSKCIRIVNSYVFYFSYFL